MSEAYTRLMNNWMGLYTRGKSIEAFFVDNHINSIAVYGCGNIGEFFYNDLKKYNVEIKLCIDKKYLIFMNLMFFTHTTLVA